MRGAPCAGTRAQTVGAIGRCRGSVRDRRRRGRSSRGTAPRRPPSGDRCHDGEEAAVLRVDLGLDDGAVAEAVGVEDPRADQVDPTAHDGVGAVIVDLVARVGRPDQDGIGTEPGDVGPVDHAGAALAAGDVQRDDRPGRLVEHHRLDGADVGGRVGRHDPPPERAG